MLGTKAWDALTTQQQYALLGKRVDLLVLAYMHQEGAITQEQYDRRVAEVKAR